MIIIKLLLVLIFSFAILVVGLSEKYQTYKRVLFMLLYALIVVLIVSPSVADSIAQWFSIEYGSDLAVYVAISVLVMIGSVNYARGHRQSRITTTLIRELAIKDVKIT